MGVHRKGIESRFGGRRKTLGKNNLYLNRGLGDKLARKGVEGKTKGSRKKFDSKEQSPETA